MTNSEQPLPTRPRVRTKTVYVAECHRCPWTEEHPKQIGAASKLDLHLIREHGIADEEVSLVG